MPAFLALLLVFGLMRGRHRQPVGAARGATTGRVTARVRGFAAGRGRARRRSAPRPRRPATRKRSPAVVPTFPCPPPRGTHLPVRLDSFTLYVTVAAMLVLHYGSIVGDAQSRVADAWYVFFSRDPHLRGHRIRLESAAVGAGHALLRCSRTSGRT